MGYPTGIFEVTDDIVETGKNTKKSLATASPLLKPKKH